MVECPKCGEKAVKWGKRKGIQRYQCRKGHRFSLEKHAPSPSLNLTVPTTREGAPQPQQQEQPQDIAMEIIRESEKPREPEPEPKLELNSKDFNAPRQIGRFVGETIGDLLNNVFFEKEKKKKTEQEQESEYI